MKTPDELAFEVMQELPDNPADWDFQSMIAEAIVKDRAQHLSEARAAATDVDTLAAVIRAVDGNHTLGAGALAEAILDTGYAQGLVRSRHPLGLRC